MNRLTSSNSPYLLQHAANPVDWYPWGEEAFAAARRSDRPIFLSVGYSTCHWCHVMAHESFESEQIAALLNEHFVPVKVDREERPDVDRVYMTFVQATTGQGGWPMSVFLTPDLQPFYGGTYFPPDSRYGRPGFRELLRELARLWREDRERVLASARSVHEQLARATASAPGPRVPPVTVLARAVEELGSQFDDRYGGFGRAPKFPRPSELLFLLREHARSGDARALAMVTATLCAMSDGGMRDQVGGGFHRYSVDGQWRVPHFEKMLYDQAQIVLALLEAAQASGDLSLLEVAEDTLAYVARDLADPAGGFCSAEDADSLPPGAAEGAHPTEGAFYLWGADEIDRLLGADAEIAKTCFGVEPEGNALHDPQGEFRGRNILYRAATDEEAARRHGVERAEVASARERARRVLFEARASRPRPGLDDKVITAWNGLAIAAFARASRVVAALHPDAAPRAAAYLESARRAAAFLRERAWDEPRGRLMRRYRRGEAGVDGYAEDYACLVFGLIELFQAGGDPEDLRFALRLQRRQDELFWDEAGGWFGTTGEDSSMLLRLKEEYDGAEPAASSVGLLNLIALSQLGPADGGAAVDPPGAGPAATGGLPARIERTLQAFEPRLSHASRALPMMLAALSAYHADRQEIVVVGEAHDPRTRALIRAVESRYRPFAIVIRLEPGKAADLARDLPHVAGMGMRGGLPAAYICRNFTCDTPITDPAALA
ncbi:MAG TPA: thioredoxin domain-containing protein [Vicinamibacterales bacterium]|nr:thioredoxin domain-containing protein [Vicinamibacterales bacterium]